MRAPLPQVSSEALKILEVGLQPVTLRKEDPNWRFALGASPVTEGVIVRLSSEAAEGLGYASATPHMGSIAGTMLAELENFRPAILGATADRIGSVMAKLDRCMRGAPQSKAAVDCALHDLLARSLGVPVCTLLGGAVRHDLPILRILAIKSPHEMSAQARRLVDCGYRYLKIKVHGDLEDDVARVAAIREEVGSEVKLTIDANQAYSAKDAVRAITKMLPYGIDLVEQPVPAHDLEGLSYVTRSVPVTVEADEAAGTVAEIYELVKHRRVDAVSLKIPKLGGIRNTIAAAHLCEAAGVKYRMGAAVGSQLLSGFALHLACALPGVDYACELGEFERLLGDEFSGLTIRDGMLRLPAGPGVGVDRGAADRQPAVAGEDASATVL